MAKDFPHISDTSFPDVEAVDVYDYANDYDYSRWIPNTKIKVCTVPWCGDYENVPGFTSEEARDEWLDSVTGYTETLTSFYHVLPDNTIKLPINAQVLTQANYIVIDLPRPPKAADPNDYTEGARTRYCFFILDVQQNAVNTTECTLQLDVWTTYINSVEISYLMLERGHAPMASAKLSTFLANPVENNDYLLAPDVNFGEATIAKSQTAHVFNSSTVFCFATYAQLSGDWGSGNTANVTGLSYTLAQGVPAPDVWCIAFSAVPSFLNNANNDLPQFLSTIEAAFFAPSELVTTEETVTFLSTECKRLACVGKTFDFLTLGKSSFGFDSDVAGITKLYTYPYSKIVITDADGNATEIHVEDTSGKLQINAALSHVLPYLAIDMHLLGVGGSNANTYTFSNVTSHTFATGGAWFDTLMQLDIPTFAIEQRNGTRYDYAERFNRNQADYSASQTLASAQASNSTAQTNSNNAASNITSNNAVSAAAANATTATTIAQNVAGANASVHKLVVDTQYDIGNSNAAFDAEQAYLGVSATNNTVNSIVSGVTSAVTAIGGGLSRDMDAVGSGISGIVSAGTNWYTGNASITVSQSNNTAVYNQAITSAYGKQDAANEYTTNATTISNNALSSNNATNVNAATSIASNNANLVNTNAANTRNTSDANATRSYNVAEESINNGIRTAGIQKAVEFGTASGQHASTRPLAMFANVVTQPKGAIRQAACQFLRYGYALNQQWEVTDLNVMPHFSYWKAAEIWCAGAQSVTEGAQNEIKRIFLQGVTVWKKPEEIGKVSIYDNIQ